MGFLQDLLEILLHLDKHLFDLCTQYGVWVYAILFIIIFCETGLVVTPFLPGDSLLFAVGSLAAIQALSFPLSIVLLILAAVLGDTANYWIGHAIGAKAYTGEVKWIKKEYMDRTHAFFEKYGGKTIFLARFVPIIRTFAPFVAGVSEMSYGYFITWNLVGGVSWVAIFTLLGYFFGNITFVKNNFELVIIAIVLISFIPAVVEALKARKETKRQEVESEK